MEVVILLVHPLYEGDTKRRPFQRATITMSSAGGGGVKRRRWFIASTSSATNFVKVSNTKIVFAFFCLIY